MAMGRPPKPTALKLITGNPGKRPLPKHEAKIEASEPTPPEFLSVDAKTEFRRVCSILFKAGLVTLLDRAALAAYCQAYVRWLVAECALALMKLKDPHTSALMIKTSNGNAIQNPLVGIANKAMSDMVHYANEFGMTPSSRSRVDADPPPENTPGRTYFT